MFCYFWGKMKWNYIFITRSATIRLSYCSFGNTIVNIHIQWKYTTPGCIGSFKTAVLCFFSTPWALHALVLLPLMKNWSISFDSGRTVCILDGLFRLSLEFWHALAPMVSLIWCLDFQSKPFTVNFVAVCKLRNNSFIHPPTHEVSH